MTRWTAIPLLVLAILAAGCAGLPAGTYYPTPGDPNTLRVANVLHRAAVAACDDPARYTFALSKTRHPAAFTDEDATFYISDGLAQMPMPGPRGRDRPRGARPCRHAAPDSSSRARGSSIL